MTDTRQEELMDLTEIKQKILDITHRNTEDNEVYEACNEVLSALDEMYSVIFDRSVT